MGVKKIKIKNEKIAIMRKESRLGRLKVKTKRRRWSAFRYFGFKVNIDTGTQEAVLLKVLRKGRKFWGV